MIRPVPRVAMNPFTLSFVTMSPFAKPMAAATTSTASTAIGMFAGLPAIMSAAIRLERLTT